MSNEININKENVNENQNQNDNKKDEIKDLEDNNHQTTITTTTDDNNKKKEEDKTEEKEKEEKDKEEKEKEEIKSFEYLLENDEQNDKLWYYLDEQDTEEGPYTDNQMLYWLKTNKFNNSLQIRHKTQFKYHPIVAHPIFVYLLQDLNKADNKQPHEDNENAQQQQQQNQSSTYESPYSASTRYHPYGGGYTTTTTTPSYSNSSNSSTPTTNTNTYQDYEVSGVFNRKTGRFDATGKGAWTSSEERQMAHYFDLNNYQESMNRIRREKEEEYRQKQKQKQKQKK